MKTRDLARLRDVWQQSQTLWKICDTDAIDCESVLKSVEVRIETSVAQCTSEFTGSSNRMGH